MSSLTNALPPVDLCPLELFGDAGPAAEDERWLIESQYHDEQTTGGRLLNALVPALEAAGSEIRSVSEDGLIAIVSGRCVRITWEDLDARAEEGPEVPYDDPAWDCDDRWAISPTISGGTAAVPIELDGEDLDAAFPFLVAASA
jgi:hypothetical protein